MPDRRIPVKHPRRGVSQVAPAPPDNFQRRTYVRLPFADDYLNGEDDGHWPEALKEAFRRPFLTVSIAERGKKRTGAPPAGERWARQR